MRFSSPALCALTIVACGLAAAQPQGGVAHRNATSFIQDGQTYTWSIANGATGGLALSRGSSTELILSCSGIASGGLQVRAFQPGTAKQLRMRLNETVFRMRAVPAELGGKHFVEGRGDLPTAFFDALARAAAIFVEYGDQQRSFRAPGKDVAGQLERYCVYLAGRAADDES